MWPISLSQEKTRDAKQLGEESNGTEIFWNKITEIRVHVAKFPKFSGQSEPETSVPFGNSYSIGQFAFSNVS